MHTADDDPDAPVAGAAVVDAALACSGSLEVRFVAVEVKRAESMTDDSWSAHGQTAQLLLLSTVQPQPHESGSAGHPSSGDDEVEEELDAPAAAAAMLMMTARSIPSERIDDDDDDDDRAISIWLCCAWEENFTQNTNTLKRGNMRSKEKE